MNHLRVTALFIACVAVSGCATSAVTILNLVGLSEKPLIVLHVAAPKANTEQQAVAQLLDPFAPYKPIREALGKQIRRNVVPELCFGFQIEPSLRMGTSHLAVLSPLDYARIQNKNDFPLVAVPVDESGQSARPAVLVVKRDAAAQSVSDMNGKRVTFGPIDHPRTHLAAIALLESSGVSKNKLSLEVLPVPGSLRHRGTGAEIARDVAKDATYAGFIDAAEWDQLPETSQDGKIGKDQLRVVAETAAVPNRLIIASPTLKEEEITAVRSFFHTAGETHRDAVDALRLQGFAPVADDDLNDWLQVVDNKASDGQQVSKK